MNLPGFIVGLAMAASGAAGLVVWLRLSGMLKTAPDVASLGFDEAGGSVVTSGPLAERIDYASAFDTGPTIGRRLTALLGIVVFILSVGAAFALVLYQLGHQTTKLIEHFILTSPSP